MAVTHEVPPSFVDQFATKDAMADDASAAWYCADAEQQIFGPLTVRSSPALY